MANEKEETMGIATDVDDSPTNMTHQKTKGDASAWIHQLRRWLLYMETKLKESQLDDADTQFTMDGLRRRLLEQQVFQKEVERHGAILVATIRKLFVNLVDKKQLLVGQRIIPIEEIVRWKLGSLEHRWHDLWLKSLERQCRLEHKIRSRQSDWWKFDIYDLLDWAAEPKAKRPRLDLGQQFELRCNSETPDTIPFSEEEYESIMENTSTRILDANGNVIEDLTNSENASGLRDEIQTDQIDTGENSGHSMEKGDEDDRYILRDPTSVKRFYKMTPWDTDGATDTDTPRFGPPSVAASSIGSDCGQKFLHAANELLDKCKPNSPCPTEPIFLTSTPAGRRLEDSIEENSNDLDDILHLLDCESSGVAAAPNGTIWTPFGANSTMTPSKGQENMDSGNCASCDASSELSMDETGTIEGEWFFTSSRTILQTFDSQPKLGGSMKRRRKRQNGRQQNLPFIHMPASASETAITNMSSPCSKLSSTPCTNGGHRDSSCSWLMTSSMSSSGYGGGGTGNESRSTNCWRKKLRARRMSRSKSDSEHLSFLNGRYRYSSSGADTRHPPDMVWEEEYGRGEMEPSAPRATPTSDSNEETGQLDMDEMDGQRELDGEDSLLLTMGGGEAMAALHETGDDGERTAGDGGSTVSGADQSETVIWEWDDYKPPDHNENGPADQPALDDSILTAFGDDYRKYFEQMSDSCNSPGPESNREHSGYSSFQRMRPVGRSHDSDSELEEIFQVIKESQRQLRSTQTMLKQYQKHRNASATGSWLIDLLTTCERNVRYLETIIGRGQLNDADVRSPIRRKTPVKESKDYVAVADLLQNWRDVILLINRYIAEDIPAVGQDHSFQQQQCSVDEQRLCYLLQKEMRRLGASLKRILSQGASKSIGHGRPAATASVYRSVEETEQVVDYLKTVRQELLVEKKRLEAIVKGYNASVHQFSSQCDSIGAEVTQLKTCFEQAYLNFDNQLRELETLREHWTEWRQIEDSCRELVESLEAKLVHLEQRLASDGINHDEIETLKMELSQLEDRVAHLETLCNELASSRLHAIQCGNDMTPAVDQSTLNALRGSTASMRRDMDSLKAKLTDQVEKAGLIDIGNIPSGEMTEKDETDEKSSGRVVSKQLGNSQIRGARFWFWPIQLCLLVILILDVFFFYPSCCEHINRYWWDLGPKIRYSHGPPPT